MAKFKKGDRVIATSSSTHYNKGQIGTVDEDGDTAPYVIWDIDKKRHAAAESNLELIHSKQIELDYQIY